MVVSGDIGFEIRNIDYYEILTEIIELQYLDGRRVVLFWCKWFDVNGTILVHDKEMGVGAKIDEYGFTSINYHCLLKTNEPFVLVY